METTRRIWTSANLGWGTKKNFVRQKILAPHPNRDPVHKKRCGGVQNGVQRRPETARLTSPREFNNVRSWVHPYLRSFKSAWPLSWAILPNALYILKFSTILDFLLYLIWEKDTKIYLPEQLLLFLFFCQIEFIVIGFLLVHHRIDWPFLC